MYRSWVPEASFYELLQRIDLDLAETAREAGCWRCRGVLHRSLYDRKPRGGPPDLGVGYEKRWSFCCAVRDCRKRTTPVSVRFLGRKVYLGAVVVLATALRHGPTPARVGRLRELFGVSVRTLRRWRSWWQGEFVRQRFWRVARARFAPPVAEHALPHSLVERFAGARGAGVERALRFLSPITTGSAGRAERAL